MSKHGWQRQFCLFYMLGASVLGTTLVSGESAAPIPGFPEDLTLRAARAAHAPAEPPSIPLEEVPAYVTWRENSQRYANIRAEYTYENGTTLDCPRRKDFPDLSDVAFLDKMKSCGAFRVSRSGATLDPNSGLQRFEYNYVVSASGAPDGQAGHDSFVEIHGVDTYYQYSPSQKSGAIWKEWRRDQRYPILEVQVPNPATTHFRSLSESGTVMEFRTEHNDLLRYHLDPAQGMMPVRIEYYDILDGGGLFLYRFYTVEEYTRTENGTFVPSRSTLHDLVYARPDGTLSVKVLNSYTLTSFEEDVTFPPEEFVFTFPEGTRVTNHITGGETVVGAPGK